MSADQPTDLVVPPVAIERLALVSPDERARRVFEAWIAARSPNTLDAYERDLSAFAVELLGRAIPSGREERAATASFAGAALMAMDAVDVNYNVMRWRNKMSEAGRSSSTINRRLASVRSVVRFAGAMGLVRHHVEVRSVAHEPRRDATGPGIAVVHDMVVASAARCDAKGLRDVAILRLLFDLGLRRASVVGIDVADVDVIASTVSVRLKGKRERYARTMPVPTKAAVVAWMDVRGPDPGPLFVPLDRSSIRKPMQRLAANGLYKMVVLSGAAAGAHVAPHGIRHTAITTAIDQHGLRSAQAFAHHANPATTVRYDDAAKREATTSAASVAAALDALDSPSKEPQ